MFESLTEKLQITFKNIRGLGKLSESNIADATREIRLALLEADVNYEIVKEFVESVKNDCLGVEVVKTVSPGEQLVKIVNDRLRELMGEAEAPLDLSRHPAVIMLVGLHGTGKTTTCAKLAAHLRKENRSVLLVAGDIYRPAAIDQLEILGREIDVPVLSDRIVQDVAAIAKRGVDQARREGLRTVIIDTAGRLQIDDDMIKELERVKAAVDPTEIMLVADAALGQEAVSVADHFHKALDITGVILTKMDGDSRGGAALSIRKVTNRPIKFIGVGEKTEDFEVFHPDRMASRILGMGDIVSLVEKAAEKIDEEEAAKMAEKLKKNTFDFNDFLQQIRQMREMGGMESVLNMLPGGANIAKMPGMDGNETERMEAIILSMTKKERSKPDTIDFPRRKRIAQGSGTSIEAVGQLVKQFSMLRKMMKKRGMLGRVMGAMMGGGLGGALAGMGGGAMPAGMGGLPPMEGFGGGGGSNFTPSKKKKRKKKKRR
ncbi:MAG: signal recognition particle protein [Kiritimatiellaeota bacterium]|nr:signal recognition particle protein [Kiritimatiellota bacterium]